MLAVFDWDYGDHRVKLQGHVEKTFTLSTGATYAVVRGFEWKKVVNMEYVTIINSSVKMEDFL